MPTPPPISAGHTCQAILHYHTCNCRAPTPFYFCNVPRCSHGTPSLIVVSALPFACRSEQTARRGWRQSSTWGGRGAVRSPACTARDAACYQGSAREEDTAGRLRDREIVVLEGCDGLCGEALDRVVPGFVNGDWRGEVLRRHRQFRNRAAVFTTPVVEKKKKKNIGVIGDRIPRCEPGASTAQHSSMTRSRQLFETSEPDPREDRMKNEKGSAVSGSENPKKSTLDILLDSIPEGDFEHRSALAELIRILGILSSSRDKEVERDIAATPIHALDPAPETRVIAEAEGSASGLVRFRGSSNTHSPLGQQSSRDRSFSNVFSGLPLPRVVPAPKAVVKPGSHIPATSKSNSDVVQEGPKVIPFPWPRWRECN